MALVTAQHIILILSTLLQNCATTTDNVSLRAKISWWFVRWYCTGMTSRENRHSSILKGLGGFTLLRGPKITFPQPELLKHVFLSRHYFSSTEYLKTNNFDTMNTKISHGMVVNGILNIARSLRDCPPYLRAQTSQKKNWVSRSSYWISTFT